MRRLVEEDPAAAQKAAHSKHSSSTARRHEQAARTMLATAGMILHVQHCSSAVSAPFSSALQLKQ
jgi:hypothetical protein